jgi:hypothetical protein
LSFLQGGAESSRTSITLAGDHGYSPQPALDRFCSGRDIRLQSSPSLRTIETQIRTINARHSPKYFGLQKGVSSYTLVANHVPINAKVIGTHEHESHYVFDLLYNRSNLVPHSLRTAIQRESAAH